MTTEKRDIEQYLEDVKQSVDAGRYRIDLNPKRQKNIQLYTDYVLNEKISKQIILSLTVENFSHILQNEHKGYEHELLYVFGRDVKLIERFGEGEEIVSLYIKFNKLNNQFIIVISFHKQEHPLRFPFR